jgi:ubiquitin C
VTVDPNDTIYDVKQKVQDQEGIPKDEQQLNHKGKHLGDGTTLAENRIKHGSTLDLAPMQIYVKDTEGKTFLVDVKPTDAIEEVKEKIKDKQGIPKEHQRLAFKGLPLEDDKTLRDYGVQHKSTLELKPMQIHVVTPAGKKVALTVDPNDKVKDVKRQVARKEGIPVDQQRLEFGGEPLKDDNKLSDYGIQHGDSVDMDGMQICVKDWNGKQFALAVDPTDTIDDVKGKIADKEGIPRDQQRLTFGGKSLDKDHNKTLQDCEIKHESNLDLEPMQIHIITPEGKKISLNVDPNNTVEEIKKMVEDKEGIPPKDQRLLFNGKELDDGPTLNDCGIKHGSNLDLDLDLEGMQIYVKDWKKNKSSFDVVSSETLESVKAKIQEEKSIPLEQQYIIFGGELLEDDSRTLSDYNIEHKSTLNLDRMKISVVTPTGKFVLDVDPTTTIGEIKQKVQDKAGIPKESQVVEHQGKKLSNPSYTMADNTIQYKDTLNVDIQDGPEYTVQVGPWQNPFDYNPKSKVKREGTRKRSTYNKLGDFYATARNTDVDVNKWDIGKDEEGDEK